MKRICSIGFLTVWSMLKLLIKVMGKPGRLANSAADLDVIDIRGIDERMEYLVSLAIHTVNNNCMRHFQLNFFFYSRPQACGLEVSVSQLQKRKEWDVAFSHLESVTRVHLQPV